MARLTLLFLATLLSGCAWMGHDLVEGLEGEDVVSRGTAKLMLRQAVGINAGKCNENAQAALFAADAIIPHELSRSYYRKRSIDNCVVAILLVPCGINPSSNSVLISSIYRIVLRSCNPEPAID